MRLTLSLWFGLMIDLRLLSFTALGCSLVYARVDCATHTVVMLDLERVAKSHRTKLLEGLARFGPWTATNRTYYVA